MRRSDFVMKLMSVVLFIAIAAYIGLYIYQAADKPLKTTVAVRYTVEDTGGAEGYIIRTESVLSGDGNTATLMAAEGEKLAVGQAVAIYYQGETALAQASTIRQLQLEIKQAQTDAALSSDQKTVNADASVLALSNAVQHKNYSNLEDLTLGIKKTVFADSGNQLSETDLAALNDRLTNLLSKNTGSNTIYTPVSGVFSAAVDGFEDIGPDKIKDLTPSSLQALFTTPNNTGGAPLGKLITGIKWYYAAVMDASNAHKLDGKDTAALQFTKSYNAQLDMAVESIGAEENGKCVVVFSAKRGISEMTVLRKLTAQIEFSSYTGLSIPKEAVYRENGDKTYIYLLTGLQAEKVSVDILSENGSSYIVKDGTENGTVLREGSEIIVKAKDLHDRKVVAR